MQQKKADESRQENDQKQVVLSEQQQELERQKAEIEKLKRVIVKMSKNDQLTAENQTVVSSASRMAGGSKSRKGKNID